MNKQPYVTPPRWWEPKLTPVVVRGTRRYRRWSLKRRQKIESVRVRGEDGLRAALDSNHGVLITPNHAAHYDSAALYLAADQLDTPLYFMTAWQVFGMARRWDRFLMQRMGCFSVNRESSDRRAYKQGVEILQKNRYPLVIFPEGDIYHVTDRVTPFRDGAAAVAVSAARRGNRQISVVPCGIKFWYVEDPTEQLHRLMTRLDERLLLQPEPKWPLPKRIYRFAEALLSLKEIEYLGSPMSGELTTRIRNLAASILEELEDRYQVQSQNVQTLPDRVKELRQRIITLSSEHGAAATRIQEVLTADMDALFLVMQLYSYPGDYLIDMPTTERLAETLDKLEEDVLGSEIPSVHGRRRVEIEFGEPFLVSASAKGRNSVQALTQKMHGEVQSLVDGLNESRSESPSFVSENAWLES